MKGYLTFFIAILITLNLVACARTTVDSACSAGTTPPAETGPESCLIRGYEVKNTQGERLGVVDDVFVDAAQGRIAYVTILFDDPHIRGKAAMAMSTEKFVPVPWDFLQPVAGQKLFLLNADLTMLANAPHFDRLPPNLDPETETKIVQYWAKKEYNK